jgi:hypothetical protein
MGEQRATYRSVDPPTAIEVVYRGVWRPGFLLGWQCDGDAWSPYVRFQGAHGMILLTIVPLNQVRDVAGEDLAPPDV